MLSRLKKILNEESGSAVVLAAVALVVVLSVSGLVIDLGQAYVEASNVQTAADSAALAAGMQLPVSLSDSSAIQQVQLTALEYVQKNGFDPSAVLSVELTDVYSDKYYGVKVNLVSNVPYYFGPIIGIDAATISKSAKSLLAPVTSTDAAVPLGIETGQLSTVITDCLGQHVKIKYGGGGGSGGFFGALDLDGVKGGGAKDFETWLAFGYGGELTSGTVLPIEPGNMAGPTTSAFLTRFNQCTHFPGQGGCTLDHFENKCPRVITLIAYTMVDSNSVRVQGFVPFVLESANGDGEIVASMVTMLTNEGQADGNLGGTGDYGIYKVRLAE